MVDAVDNAAEDSSRMTIGEHLEELRSRLVRSLLAVGLGFGVAFWQIDRVVWFMMQPLNRALSAHPDTEVITTKVYAGFTGSFKIAFFAGLLFASPVILHQLWSFIGAGLYERERRTIKWYAVPGFLLFLAGVWLAYSFVLPFALDFLIGWTEGLGFKSMLDFSAFLSLIAFGMFMFGLLFQLPVVMVFMMRVGMVEPATFRKFRRHAIVGNFVVAMLFTPPDVVSQIALAVCMIILYEGAILVGTTMAKPQQTEE